MSRSIAKNTAFMTMASIGQKIISFVYFTMIARMVGVEGTGMYFFALSFTTIFVVFVDMGLTNVMIRESAKVKEKMQTYFSTVLSVKVLLGVLSYIGAFVAINLMGYSVEIRHMVYLSAVTMLFDSVHLTMYGVLRAVGDLKYEAISITISQLLTLILGSIFLYFHFPLIFLILAFTIPSFLNVCFASSILVWKLRFKLVPSLDKQSFVYLGRIAIPFAIAGIFARVYSYVDSILLSKLAGNVAVGLYSIPYKITYAFQFIPLALVAAMFPRFSEYFVSDRKRLAYIFQQGLKYLLIIATPIAVGVSVLAKDIILTLYTSQYVDSILPLQILIFSLIFSYLSFPIGAFLNACNRQVTQTVIIGVVMVINIALNLFLIPIYGIVGAATSAFVGNFLLTAIGYAFVPKVTAISHSFMIRSVLQIFTSAIVMGFFVIKINEMSHFILAILVGVVVYPTMLFVTRAINMVQFKKFMGTIAKSKA